jgi:hypothetical protein
MSTNDDNKPSFFARYIDGPEKERPSPLEKMIKQSRKNADLKTFLMDILANGPVRWPRLSEQFFRVDKWSLCRG